MNIFIIKKINHFILIVTFNLFMSAAVFANQEEDARQIDLPVVVVDGGTRMDTPSSYRCAMLLNAITESSLLNEETKKFLTISGHCERAPILDEKGRRVSMTSYRASYLKLKILTNLPPGNYYSESFCIREINTTGTYVQFLANQKFSMKLVFEKVGPDDGCNKIRKYETMVPAHFVMVLK